MRPYSIEFLRSAQKEYEALELKLRERVRKAIDGLAINPRPRTSKKLEGEDHYYRIRIGDYRVVYHIDDKVSIVLIERIRHRGDVYR